MANGGIIAPVSGESTFTAPYPFIRCTYSRGDEDGYWESPSWKPGVEWQQASIDDSDAVAHGVGSVVYTVVATFKPGKYPERVFFTRQWISPDGNRFGKSRLHIATAEKFRRLVRGYRYEYSVAPPSPEAGQ